jgi:hypothetical protein
VCHDLNHEFSRSHKTTHHIRWDSSELVISSSQSTHNTHNRQTSMPPAGFEPTISAGNRPQTYALDDAATGIGKPVLCCTVNVGQVTSGCHEIPVREGYDQRNKIHFLFFKFLTTGRVKRSSLVFFGEFDTWRYQKEHKKLKIYSGV